jgi:hypothetical protein
MFLFENKIPLKDILYSFNSPLYFISAAKSRYPHVRRKYPSHSRGNILRTAKVLILLFTLFLRLKAAIRTYEGNILRTAFAERINKY